MTRTKFLLPLSLAGVLALAALTPSAISTLQGPSEPVAGIKANHDTTGNNRAKEKNHCKYPANTRPTITQTATPQEMSKPGIVKFSGAAKANCGLHKGQMGLYGKDGPSGSSGSWTLRSTTTTLDDGTYTFTYRVPKTADFKVVWPGDDSFPAAQSAAVTVKVGK